MSSQLVNSRLVDRPASLSRSTATPSTGRARASRACSRSSRARGIRATFFFTFGPDRSGVAVAARLHAQGLPPEDAPLARGRRSTAGARCSTGTLLPAPSIGRAAQPTRCAPPAAAGHETGVHGWDHVGWHDRLDRMAPPSASPTSTAAPTPSTCASSACRRGRAPRRDGPSARARSRSEEERSLLYTSDTRVRRALLPVGRAERVFSTLEIPTTLPTLDETLAWPELSGDEDAARASSARPCGAPRSTRSTRRSRGDRRRSLFAAILDDWIAAGVGFSRLSELAREALAHRDRDPGSRGRERRASRGAAGTWRPAGPSGGGPGGHVGARMSSRGPLDVSSRESSPACSRRACAAIASRCSRAFSGNYDFAAFADAVGDPAPRRRPLPRDRAVQLLSRLRVHAPRRSSRSATGSALARRTCWAPSCSSWTPLTAAVLYATGRRRTAGRGGGVLFFAESRLRSSSRASTSSSTTWRSSCCSPRSSLWARRLRASGRVPVALRVAARQAHHRVLPAALRRVSRRARLEPAGGRGGSVRRLRGVVSPVLALVGRRARSHVLDYRSLSEDYGVGMLLTSPGLPRWLPGALFVAAVLAALALLRAVPRERACLLLFLVMLLFAPGICEYYFVWPIALGALYGGAGYLIYTVTSRRSSSARRTASACPCATSRAGTACGGACSCGSRGRRAASRRAGSGDGAAGLMPRAERSARSAGVRVILSTA